MIRIVEGGLAGKREALMPLLAMHREELTTRKDIMVLKPRWDAYEAMEKLGALVTLFVYDEDELIGYSAAFVSSHFHYADLVYAHVDVLFLHPAYRDGSTGLRLIAETEKACRAAHATFIVMHAKPDTKLQSLLPKLGYAVQDVMYSKEI